MDVLKFILKFISELAIGRRKPAAACWYLNLTPFFLLFFHRHLFGQVTETRHEFWGKCRYSDPGFSMI